MLMEHLHLISSLTTSTQMVLPKCSSQQLVAAKLDLIQISMLAEKFVCRYLEHGVVKPPKTGILKCQQRCKF